MNKPSDNFFAEMLTKGLGASFGGGGTTARGVKVERAFLVSLGIAAKTFRLTDGSGLSYDDRLTTLDITTLLRRHVAAHRLAGLLELARRWPASTAPCRDRMRGTAAQKNLHGKTGTLTVASNLSGYVTSANGEWLAFSMLMNTRVRIDVTAAHAAQDAIGVALARSRPGGKVVWSPSPAPGAN